MAFWKISSLFVHVFLDMQTWASIVCVSPLSKMALFPYQFKKNVVKFEKFSKCFRILRIQNNNPVQTIKTGLNHFPDHFATNCKENKY